jgi:hypothetical protein
LLLLLFMAIAITIVPLSRCPLAATIVAIAIVLLLFPSPFEPPTIIHCRHHRPSQLHRHPAIHCAVAAVTHCNCTTIMPHCIPS